MSSQLPTLLCVKILRLARNKLVVFSTFVCRLRVPRSSSPRSGVSVSSDAVVYSAVSSALLQVVPPAYHSCCLPPFSCVVKRPTRCLRVQMGYETPSFQMHACLVPSQLSLSVFHCDVSFVSNDDTTHLFSMIHCSGP